MNKIVLKQRNSKIWIVLVNGEHVFTTHRGFKGAVKAAEFQLDRITIHRQGPTSVVAIHGSGLMQYIDL